jgi:hypothetical protein
MIANFLDYRASVNAPGTGLINIGISHTNIIQAYDPSSYIASIGLIVGNATNMRVHLQGQIGVESIVSAGPLNDVYIYIYRCADPFNVTIPSGDQIYYAVHRVYSREPRYLTINIADFPLNSISGQLTYSLFAWTTGFVSRIGPESFEGFAMTNS